MSVFLSDEDLTQALLDTLQKSAFEEVNSWDEIITNANTDAYNDIVRILVGNGYTVTQILAWDAGRSFNLDLGLFWCLVRGGCTKDFDPTFIDKLDRRAELLALGDTQGGMLNNGVLVYPSWAVPRVSGGKLSSKGDVFNMHIRT